MAGIQDCCRQYGTVIVCIDNECINSELAFDHLEIITDAREHMRKLVAIIVGGGNNGGDGYALAGILKNSDMNGDTGEAELAVRSDLTVSIGCFKQGLFKGRAKEYIGRLTIVDIGISLIDENGEEI